MARSILSFGMLCALAAMIAERSRGLKAGSGMPSLAAMVISRPSLAKSWARTLSCLPLRCMMFLNCEWPAMVSLRLDVVGGFISGRRAEIKQPLSPESGPGLFQNAAEPHRRHAPGEPG